MTAGYTPTYVNTVPAAPAAPTPLYPYEMNLPVHGITPAYTAMRPPDPPPPCAPGAPLPAVPPRAPFACTVPAPWRRVVEITIPPPEPPPPAHTKACVMHFH